VPIAMLGLLEKVGDPTIQPEQLPDIAKEQVEKQIINQNPNKTLYKVDDFITTPSGLVQVTGYDEDGEPLVKRVNK